MPKFKIEWNAGFGRCTDIVEAETHAEALDIALDMAVDQFESNAQYTAEPVEETEPASG